MVTDSALTVREVAQRYGVGEHTVLGWIRSGQLRAINVGRNIAAKKPRWRITAEALETFELVRLHTSPQPGRRQRKRQAEVVEFY